MNLELELKKSNLKVQALLEKISSLTTNYENESADYRVQITIITHASEEAINEIKELNERLSSKESDSEKSS